jgi:hypothetical protein
MFKHIFCATVLALVSCTMIPTYQRPTALVAGKFPGGSDRCSPPVISTGTNFIPSELTYGASLAALFRVKSAAAATPWLDGTASASPAVFL